MSERFPVRFESLREQSVMATVTYEEAVVLTDICDAFLQALPAILKNNPQYPAESSGAIAARLKEKFGACALSLEAMHIDNAGGGKL